MIDSIKTKYTDSGFILKEDFDKKLSSVYGPVDWKANTTEILFSMMSVLPYVTLRRDKLDRLLSMPNFNRFFFYSTEEDGFNVFLSFSYKHIADFKILKNRLYEHLWEKLSLPVKDSVVIIESDFEADLLIDRDTKVEKFLDLNLELSNLSLSDAVEFKRMGDFSAYSVNGLMDVKAKTNYKIISIRSEV